MFTAHIQSVRLFLRDFSELNLLIRGEESSDRMIAWATFDFISDFNTTPHFTGYTLESMVERGWASFAIRGTVISLLQSLIIMNTRNHLPFSDGGMSASIFDRAPMLINIVNMFQSAYEQQKRMIKIAINIESLLDCAPSGVQSEYSQLAAIGYY